MEASTRPQALGSGLGDWGGGGGEAPGWVDRRCCWKQLHPIKLHPAPSLVFKVYLTGSGLCFPLPRPHSISSSLVSFTIFYLCRSAYQSWSFLAPINYSILFPQVATSLLGPTHISCFLGQPTPNTTQLSRMLLSQLLCGPRPHSW